MKIFCQSAILLLGLLFTGCRREQAVGRLYIEAPQAGHFDIYKLTDKSDLDDNANMEWVAEVPGVFNESMELAPGSYLISADCSAKNVMIYPKQDLHLSVDSVDFKPARPPQPTDRFSIECVQQSSIQMTQVIKNRFRLFMFAGNHSLLVNQVSQQINIDESREPQQLEIALSALNVARHAQQTNPKAAMYFVSNFKEQIGLTTAQEQGYWQHLLPGRYSIEMNATRITMDLVAGQELVVKPALLKFSVPEDVDLEKAETVLRSPLYVDLNDGHFLSYNTSYPILAGKFSFRPSQYLRDRQAEVQAAEVKEIPLKSIEVDSNCSPWDYSCIGAYDIHLFEESEIYPLVKAVSGVPIIYLDEPLQFAVQGSSRIKVPVTDKRAYNIGRIIIRPSAIAEEKYATDLIRVENQDSKGTAFTNDLAFDRENVLILPEGHYYLANYVTMTGESGMRKRLPQTIEVSSRQDNIYYVPVYLSSEKAVHLEKQLNQQSSSNGFRADKGSVPEIPVF